MRALRAGSGAVALVVAACATGCFNDRGLAIEVDTSKLTGKAKQVELFIGMTACTDANDDGHCAMLTPKSLTSMSGAIWYRDAAKATVAEVSGSSASIRLEASKGSADTALPLVVVVATDAAGAVIGLAVLDNNSVVVPAHDAKIINVALTQASTITTTPESTSDQAYIWTSQESGIGSSRASECLVVKHGTDANNNPLFNFIVPNNDVDCDGVTTDTDASRECDPNVYAATELEKVSCFDNHNATSTCMVGGVLCKDGSGPQAGTCEPSPVPICVPADYCMCASGDIDCIKTHIEPVTHIRCDITSSGKTQSTCESTEPMPIQLGKVADSECGDDIAIANLDTIEQDGFTKSAVFGGARIAVASGGSGGDKCAFQIQWKQGAHTPSATVDRGFIRLSNASHKLVIPIDFNFDIAQGECQIACTLMGDNDPMFTSCVTP